MLRLLMPLALILFSQCSSTKASKESSTSESAVVSIQWGKSFGLCRGYCFEEFTFTKDSVFRERKSWQPDLYPAKDSSWLDSAPYSLFAVHSNFDSLHVLGERLGCPDCADGGSEWLAFRMADGRVHKVVFEFGSSPESQSLLLMHIREWYDRNFRK